jgi:hypothetical protein
MISKIILRNCYYYNDDQDIVELIYKAEKKNFIYNLMRTEYL